jgi:electron transport complex protein RnfD
MNNSPYILKPASVQSVMLRVLLALLPGIAAYVWFFGAAVLVQIALASITALAAEALMLKMRGKPVAVPDRRLGAGHRLADRADLSADRALVADRGRRADSPSSCQASLWRPRPEPVQPGDGRLRADDRRLSVADVAMAGGPATDFAAAECRSFGPRQLDAITMATPLDALRTALHTEDATRHGGRRAGQQRHLRQHRRQAAGNGLPQAIFLGGLWLLQQRIITWHMPAAFLATLLVISGGFWLFDPSRFAGPSFHLFTGGAMLGAFFIVTDPVSGCTTPRGKLILRRRHRAADLGHPHLRRLSGWHRFCRAADEHRRAADRHEHPATGVWPQDKRAGSANERTPVEIARRESSVAHLGAHGRHHARLHAGVYRA